MNNSNKSVYMIPRRLEQVGDLYEWYRLMRETNPVFFDPDRECWDLFLYEDVKRVLQDHYTFSSHKDSVRVDGLLSMDPPDHTAFRSFLGGDFKPKNISLLAKEIQQQTDVLMDSAISSKQIEIMNDIAFPLPIRIISNLLGLPSKDYRLFQQWSQNIVNRTSTHDDCSYRKIFRQMVSTVAEMDRYFESIVAEKRLNPQSDIISNLALKRVNDQFIEDKVLYALIRMILVAGNETTANLIGNTVVSLIENPNIRSEIQNDFSLLPAALEEVLRYRSPVQCLIRTAKVDVEIGGKQIKKGQKIIVWIGSANRDENIFFDSEAFCLERVSNPHLAFGFGIHRCIGAPLARLEAKIVLTNLLERFPNMRFSKPIPHKSPNFFVFEYKNINLVLE